MANKIRGTKSTTKRIVKSVDNGQTENLKREEFKKSPNFVSLYVNSTNFGHTKFDFQISLNRVDISRDTDKKFIEEQAIVTMTPEYAKALLMDFARVLKNYEDEFGEIVLRPHITNKPE